MIKKCDNCGRTFANPAAKLYHKCDNLAFTPTPAEKVARRAREQKRKKNK